MRKRSKLGKYAIWAVIFAGAYFAYRKTRALRVLPSASGPASVPPGMNVS